MATRSNDIFPILILTIQFCTAQIHSNPWTIPIVTDEQGNLCFGDPFEQNETAQDQTATDKPQLTDEVPIPIDLPYELHTERSSVHVSQPPDKRTLLTDEDIESLSARVYQPVNTFTHSVEVHQNNANAEASQQDVPSTLTQETVATDTGTEPDDYLMRLAYGLLGPLSVHDINIEPLTTDTEKQISLDDKSRASNALMACDQHQLNTSDPRALLDVSESSFGSTVKKVGNIGEQRDPNVAYPGISGLAAFFKSFVGETEQRPFRCSKCQKVFHTSADYQKHQRIHTTEKPFQCDLCQKKFSDRSNCQKHRRMHTGEKPFQCDICAKQFSSHNNYKRHRRTHTGEKPFKCDFCQKEFSDRSNYQTHRRIHTDDKQFQCDICSKQFCTSTNYKTHRRTHTGEKPFECDICLKRFFTSANCQTHRRIHTGEKPFECEFCHKKFYDRRHLQQHRRIHTGEKPFQCNMCPKQFRTSSDYRVHRRRHHENNRTSVIGVIKTISQSVI